MKYALVSKHLLTLLAIAVVLTGFSYSVQPGRLSLKTSNVTSVSIDNHSIGGYRTFTDAKFIDAAVQTVSQMKKTDEPDTQVGNVYRHYTFRLNFRDGSIRSFYMNSTNLNATLNLHPFNKGETYVVDGAIMAELLQRLDPNSTPFNR